MTDKPSYERIYDVEGYKEKILLHIFDPKPIDVDYREWRCEYRLEAPFLGLKRKLRWGQGDCRLEAFTSALILITIELRALSRRSGTFISFMGDKDIDLIDRDFY
jgi:hypothetical protein